jgi:hypothetical protein
MYVWVKFIILRLIFSHPLLLVCFRNLRSGSLFMAPSSLSGDDLGKAGFGMYTTRSLREGEYFDAFPNQVNVPVVDSSLDEDDEDDEVTAARERWVDNWNGYWWGNGVPSPVLNEADSVHEFMISFGTLPNHHCLLASLNWHYSDPSYDDTLLVSRKANYTLANRRANPGTGAFVYGTGRHFSASKPLQAGEEIFLDYGKCSAATRLRRQHQEGKLSNNDSQRYEWIRRISTKRDYQKAAEIVWKYGQRYFAQKELHISEAADNASFPLPRVEDLDVSSVDEYVRAVLPQTQDVLIRVLNGTTSLDMLVHHLARHSGGNVVRSAAWVREHGFCLNHLYPKKSGLPHAGHGAFVKHAIKKGDLIAPVPLMHIDNRDVLRLYLRSGEEDEPTLSYQLLLNYCFGHAESSLLLCPSTNANLVNHCSDRWKNCGPNGPNAEYRWAKDWDVIPKDGVNLSVDEIASRQGHILAMEIVALRDLAPNEEVFIDYGAEWETAWLFHVEQWKQRYPSLVSPKYSVREANELLVRTGKVLPRFISEDLRKVTVRADPYLMTFCLYWPTPLDEEEVWEQELDSRWQDMDDEQLLEEYADQGSELYAGQDYLTHNDGMYWPCSVLFLEDDGDEDEDAVLYYTVRIHQTLDKERHDVMSWHENRKPRFLTQYPSTGIRFMTHSYSSDHFIPQVFRHEISIRDEIFPEHWKNRPKSVNSS